MTSSFIAWSRRSLVAGATVTALALLTTACGGGVEVEPERESESESGPSGQGVTTGGAMPQPSTGTGFGGDGGGPTTTSGSSGEGGGATTGGGGAPATCEGARAGAACDVEGTDCVELIGQGLCDEGLPRVTSCVGGRWEVWTAISCGPFVADPTCAVPGRYLVAPSGAFEPEGNAWLSDAYGDAFEVTLEVRDDGRLYVSAEHGWTEPGSCAVRARWTLEESCDEEDGETFCSTIDRSLQLSLDQEPGVGTVELECWGECGEIVTAPVIATRL